MKLREQARQAYEQQVAQQRAECEAREAKEKAARDAYQAIGLRQAMRDYLGIEIEPQKTGEIEIDGLWFFSDGAGLGVSDRSRRAMLDDEPDHRRQSAWVQSLADVGTFIADMEVRAAADAARAAQPEEAVEPTIQTDWQGNAERAIANAEDVLGDASHGDYAIAQAMIAVAKATMYLAAVVQANGGF